MVDVFMTICEFQMFRVTVRALAMALLPVLFIVTSCAAEGSWVLWVQNQMTSFHKNKAPEATTTWVLDEAFDTHAQCDEKKKQIWIQAVEVMENCRECTGIEQLTRVPYEALNISLKPQGDALGGWWNRVFRCFPDTIDPR
jgi:hypothetical protein